MTWRADQPYNALPLLPPATEQVETRGILKACISARAALAELKQAAELLPNQGLLINLLPLLEAKDSSEIENIVTTTDKLFQQVGRFRTANRHFKQAGSIAEHYGFKAPFIGGLPSKANPPYETSAIWLYHLNYSLSINFRYFSNKLIAAGSSSISRS